MSITSPAFEVRPAEAARPTLPIFILASLALVAPLLWKFYWPTADGMDISGNQIGRDFLNTWVGPQVAFGGRASSIYDLATYQREIATAFGRALNLHNFSYPPSAIILFWPFAQLPYGAALVLWLATTFAALAAATLAVVPRARWGAALVLLALSPAVLINALSGQNGALSGALLLGGLLLTERRPLVAGVLFGLLTFKPHLGLVLAGGLLALGAWRTIGAAALTTAVLVGVSIGLFGVQPWVEYLTVNRAIQLQLLIDWKGFFIFMMPTWFAPLRTAGVAYTTAMALQSVITVGVLIAACWAVRQTSDPARRALVIATATPLALPYAFNYDLCAVAAACVWVIVGRIGVEPRWHIVLQTAWLAPLLSMNPVLLQLGIAPAALTALFALAVSLCHEGANAGYWSGRWDSNSRPLAPKASALPS